MARRIEIEVNGHASLARGYYARELIIEATGRAPVWISQLRGYSMQKHTALDVIALAEERGYDVTVVGVSTRKARLWAALEKAPAVQNWTPESSDSPEGVGSTDTPSGGLDKVGSRPRRPGRVEVGLW